MCRCVPVLLRDVYSQHLQRFHTLHHPSVSLADTGRLHLQKGVGHSAPQHRVNGLDVQSRRTLRNGILVFALKDGWRDGHGVLQERSHKNSDQRASHSAEQLMNTNTTVWSYEDMLTLILASSNWKRLELVGRTNTAGKSFVLGSTWTTIDIDLIKLSLQCQILLLLYLSFIQQLSL